MKTTLKRNALSIALAALVLTFSLNVHAGAISDTTKMAKKKMEKMKKDDKMMKEDKMKMNEKMKKDKMKMKKDSSKSKM
jgi:uncharacterized membrane protein (DUF106 family)